MPPMALSPCSSDRQFLAQIKCVNTVGTRFIASNDLSTGICNLTQIKCVNTVGTRFIASNDLSTGIRFVKSRACLELDGGKTGIQEKKPRRQRQRIQVDESLDAINRVPTVFRVFHAPKCVGERAGQCRGAMEWNAISPCPHPQRSPQR
jgi:hypothetical protein